MEYYSYISKSFHFINRGILNLRFVNIKVIFHFKMDVLFLYYKNIDYLID